MTRQVILRQIKAAKTSLMAGQAQKAADDVENLMQLLRKHPPAPADRDRLETRLAELRELAEAALSGARAAEEELQAIIRAARSLETYDQCGQRQISHTAANQPRRF